MKAFVTGGGGFLGSAIVRLLRARGDEVTSYSRGDYPALGALHVRGDLGDLKRLHESMRGHDTVFHVAAKAGIALGREPFWSSPPRSSPASSAWSSPVRRAFASTAVST